MAEKNRVAKGYAFYGCADLSAIQPEELEDMPSGPGIVVELEEGSDFIVGAVELVSQGTQEALQALHDAVAKLALPAVAGNPTYDAIDDAMAKAGRFL